MLIPLLVLNKFTYVSPDWAPSYAPGWAGIISSFFIYIYPVSVIGVLLIGIPAYLILKRYGYANYYSLAGLGALGGVAFGALATPIISSILLFAGCGLLVSSGFWLFSIYLPARLFNARL